jgi:ferric-dicitrate binding protein FerR (iron transport regulator)
MGLNTTTRATDATSDNINQQDLKTLLATDSTDELDRRMAQLLEQTVPATHCATEGYTTVCRRLGLTPRQRVAHRMARIAVCVIACMALPLALLSLYYRSELHRPINWQEAYAPYGQTRCVELPDHSSVTLNSGSKLIYPDRFTSDCRKVFLQGEGYASVAKNPDKPFILSAGEVEIRVLGTHFNVRSYAEDSKIEVTLLEGSIEMQSRVPGSDRCMRLQPGEMVKLDKQTGAVEHYDVDLHSYRPSMLGGGLFFMDQRFDEIVAYLQKCFNRPINLLDDQLASRRYIASFVHGESLDEMLASFNSDDAMSIQYEGDRINITRNKRQSNHNK